MHVSSRRRCVTPYLAVFHDLSNQKCVINYRVMGQSNTFRAPCRTLEAEKRKIENTTKGKAFFYIYFIAAK